MSEHLAHLAAAAEPYGTAEMHRHSVPEREVISFGPFRLEPHARLLSKNGEPVNLGGRAFDILRVLVRHAGTLVTKRELVGRVWKEIAVEECSLRFHVSELRRALGESGSSANYIKTIVGQGYCFVTPVTSACEMPVPGATQHQQSRISYSAPPALARMVGRDETVETISEMLIQKRFVTVVGPGGVGKTTVALAALKKLARRFDGSTMFLNLGSLSNPTLLPTVITSALGLAIYSNDPAANLIAFLRDKTMLLMLDSCELVIDAAAVVAEHLFQAASGVHLLATSREALRIEGEHVFQLPPLESPPDRAGLSSSEILDFPAVQLFIERVGASGRKLELDDMEMATVAEICRKLDGIPLAIELAAGWINAFGVRGTADLLYHPLDSLNQGRRTALARHQSLAATLDWSYEHLPENERVLFRRLSVFPGEFTLDSAHTMLGESAERLTELALASLVAKSLVVADIMRPVTRYRILHTTRVYGRRKLAESGEADAIARSYFESLPPFAKQHPGDLASRSILPITSGKSLRSPNAMSCGGSPPAR